MKQFVQLLICIIAGVILATVFGLAHIHQASWYHFFVTTLLAIGLYASTYGIDITEARKHLSIIVSAVTIGVLLKALIIGATLALLFNDPFFFILGVMVAQIDPLSVAVLMKGKRLSAKAKAILGAWASFDDPITVILALYVPAAVAHFMHSSQGGSQNVESSLLAFALNIAFAGCALLIWLGAKLFIKRAKNLKITAFGILALAFPVTIYYGWMLAIALVGLFIRPPIERFTTLAVTWALRIAAVLLGILLYSGVNIMAGLALGVAAYGAQVIVGLVLCRKLSSQDRWHIAFAQQNGITAIILSLLFEPFYPGTVAIVAPAILVINLLHAGVNRLYDARVNR